MLEKIFISLSDDLLFKEAFTHKDNRLVLIDFLTTMTHFTKEVLLSQDIRISYESVLSKTKVKDKSMRGDVLIEFGNYKINLEAYSYFDEASFDKSTSYIMRIFSTQLDRGEGYGLLESIIQINIIDNVEIPFDENMKSEYYLINANNIEDKKLADKFVMKYYRLDKAREKEYNELDRETRWLKFIGAKTWEERKRVAEGDELLMEFDNWIEEYVNDEKTKKIFGQWAEHIALNKGIKQGIEHGNKQNNIKIIHNLLAMNTSMKDISKITGLSLKEIENLLMSES